MRSWAAAIAVLVSVLGPACQAATLTGASLSASHDDGLRWDTFPSPFVLLGIKAGAAFINPNDEALDYDLTTPGVYPFEIRLNKGTGRNMSAYEFALSIDDRPSPAILVTADVDFTGGTPPVSGSPTYFDVTLTRLRLTTLGELDEVGEFSAGADGNVDYVGSFELTVVPEPSTLALLSLGTLVFLTCAWRRR